MLPNLLQEFDRCSLDHEGEEALVTKEGLFYPRLVPRGVRNATPLYQSTTDKDLVERLVDKMRQPYADGTPLRAASYLQVQLKVCKWVPVVTATRRLRHTYSGHTACGAQRRRRWRSSSGSVYTAWAAMLGRYSSAHCRKWCVPLGLET